MPSNGYLSADAILSAPDITEEDVPVPEWGGKVRVRALTRGEVHKIRYDARIPNTNPLQVDDAKADLFTFIVGCVEPKFEPIQHTELAKKSAGAMQRVIGRIQTLSGMTSDAAKSGEDTAS